MTNDWMLGSLYLLMAIMLVAGSLIARREKFARTATMALAWIAIFGAGFILFTFRDDLGYVAQRLKAEATGDPVVEGHEVRIPMSIDGHFWVEGSLNGLIVILDFPEVDQLPTTGAERCDVGPLVLEATSEQCLELRVSELRPL